MTYSPRSAGPPHASSPGIAQGPERSGGTRLAVPSAQEIAKIPDGQKRYWPAGSYVVGIGHDPRNRAVWLCRSPNTGILIRSGNSELSHADQEAGHEYWTLMSPRLAAKYAREFIIYGLFLTLITRKRPVLGRST